MARKQTILVGEIGSGSSANKIERFAQLIGLKVVVVWVEDSGLYRVSHKGETDFFPSPNSAIVHLCEVARVWQKHNESKA